MPPVPRPAHPPTARKKRPDEPADHALGRSRGGFGTKLHVVCSGEGVPLAVTATAGQTHESTQAESLLDASCEAFDLAPVQLAGDKAYSSQAIRDWLAERDIAAVIARPANQKQPPDECFDRATYRRRNVIERLIGWLKECRAVGTRFEKYATNFLGMVRLAFIQMYLRLLDSSDTA